MNKSFLYKGGAALAAVLLLCTLFAVCGLKRELREVKNICNNLQTALQNASDRLESQILQAGNETENLLRQQQSLFSGLSIETKLQDGKIAVTMRAVPKELHAGEKLLASIRAGEKVYQQELDGDYQACILVDRAKTIEPMFIMQSEFGVRQEVVDPIDTTDLFSAPVWSGWEEDGNALPNSMILRLMLEEKESLHFARADIAAAEFLLVRQAEAQSGTEQADWPDGITVPAIPLDENGGEVGYWADFSPYAAAQDGTQYQIYFRLFTRDGQEYRSNNGIAEFSVSPGSGSYGSGSGMLEPVF